MRDRTLAWLWKAPGRKKGIIAALTIVQILNGLTGVATALLLRRIVDSAVRGDTAAFTGSIILTVLLIIAQQTLNALVRWLSELGKASLENTFKGRLLHALMTKSFGAVSAVHSGEWMNRLTNDVKITAEGYTDIIPGAAGMIMRMGSALAAIILLDPRFAMLILPGGMLMLLMSFVFRGKLKKLHTSIQREDGRLRVFLQERIGSLMMIKSFAAEEKTELDAAGRMDRHKEARMRRIRISNVCNLIFGAAMQGMFLLGTCYCAWGILQGTISYGTLTAVMQLLSQIQSPFAQISGLLPKYYAMIASAERLMEAEAFPEDGKGAQLSKKEIRSLYEERMESFGLFHADYTYDAPTDEMGEDAGERMPVVLRDLTIEIRKGEYLAFTGPSGCGKSTALKLLMSMYPLDSGERLIRTVDGERIPLDARCRRLFAYVPQGNQLMTGTIRQIVSFSETGGKPDDRKVEEALRLACADEFTGGLEEGLDTLLGERGAGLSEGQMQRIAIARALYSEAPVLLLDEATSALDAEKEKKLLLSLKNLTDRTVVIVTHRDAALKICDREIEFTEKGAREK